MSGYTGEPTSSADLFYEVGVYPASEFGVIADGATPCAARINALQAAITAKGAAPAATIWLPAGVIAIEAPIIQVSGIRIVGAGRTATTVRLNNGVNQSVMTAAAGVAGISIAHLTIDGNKTGNAVTGNGLSWAGVVRGTIEDVRGTNCRDDGFLFDAGCDRIQLARCEGDTNSARGFHFKASFRLQMTQLLASGNALYGIDIDGGCLEVQGSLCHAFSNTLDGFLVEEGSQGVTFSACGARTNGGNGFNLNQQTPGTLKNITLDGCWAYRNTLNGFRVQANAAATFWSDVTWVGCQSFENSFGAPGVSDGFFVGVAGGAGGGDNISLVGNQGGDRQGVPTQRYGITFSGAVTTIKHSDDNVYKGNATGPMNGTPIPTLTGATPTVTGIRELLLTQGGATNVTDFLGGYNGQTLRIRAGDANSTIIHNAALLSLQGAANFAMGAGAILTLDKYNGIWQEAGRRTP